MHRFRCFALLAHCTGLALGVPTAIAAAGPDQFAAPQAAVGTIVDFTGPLNLLIAELAPPVAALITGLLVWAGRRVLKMVGLQEAAKAAEIDERMKSALHGALQRGLEAAANRLLLGGRELTLDVKSQIVADAANRVLKFNPETVGHFKLGRQRLEELAGDLFDVDMTFWTSGGADNGVHLSRPLRAS